MRKPEETTWRGVTRYACPYPNCEYDTTERHRIEAHLRLRHIQRPSLLAPQQDETPPEPPDTPPVTRGRGTGKRTRKEDSNGPDSDR